MEGLGLGVVRRHQPGKDPQAAPTDGEIVIAAPIGPAANLHHPEPPPLGAVLEGKLLETDDSVGDAL